MKHQRDAGAAIGAEAASGMWASVAGVGLVGAGAFDKHPEYLGAVRSLAVEETVQLNAALFLFVGALLWTPWTGRGDAGGSGEAAQAGEARG